jgi:hypothetical protein
MFFVAMNAGIISIAAFKFDGNNIGYGMIMSATGMSIYKLTFYVWVHFVKVTKVA